MEKPSGIPFSDIDEKGYPEEPHNVNGIDIYIQCDYNRKVLWYGIFQYK